MSTEPMQAATPATPEKPQALAYPLLIPSIQKGEYYTSFAQIAQTGRMESIPSLVITFDKNGTDAVAKEYNEILAILRENVASDKALHQLSSPQQQADYEQALAQHVYDAIKGTTFDAANYRQAREGGNNTRSLNHLTPKDEYDCEHLTFMRGLLMHEADQTLVTQGTRKEATQFYAAAGGMMGYNSPVPDFLGGHQFIVSANTGNIIEANDNSHGYKKTNLDFGEIVAGYPAITADYLYSPASDDTHQALAEQRLRVIKSNPFDIAALGTLTQPETTGSIALSDRSNKLLEELVPAIETASAKYCTKPILIESGTGTPVFTTTGWLKTQDHQDMPCSEETKTQVVDRYKTALSTKDLAEQFISSSAKELPSLPVSAPAEAAPPTQTPNSSNLPASSLSR